MKLIDISRPISSALAVWPGDAPFSLAWVMRRQDGDPANLSTLTFSAHIGTHADAPYHVDEGGPRIAGLPLEPFIGPAVVAHVPRTGPILPADLAGVDLSRVQRLLVRTPASARLDDEWREEIAYLHPSTARLLAAHGVRLFGTDAASVDPIDSETLDAHHALFGGGVAILENLQLNGVEEGEYELIALPLNIPADGCPVRAVLRR